MFKSGLKINKKVAVPALIAILVGGLVFAAVQIKKPGPLFSSAYPAECQSWVDLANETMRQANARPILQSRSEELMSQSTDYVAELNNCSQVICDPLNAQIQELENHIREAEIILNELVEERDDFLASHPRPWSSELEQQFQAMMLSVFRAEDEIERLNMELEDAQNNIAEHGCNQGEEELVAYDAHCLEQVINSQVWCIEDPNHEYNEYDGERPGTTVNPTPKDTSTKDQIIQKMQGKKRPY